MKFEAVACKWRGWGDNADVERWITVEVAIFLSLMLGLGIVKGIVNKELG